MMPNFSGFPGAMDLFLVLIMWPEGTLSRSQPLCKYFSHFKCHELRRVDSTWAFNFGVPLDQIKAHGTWASDCMWRYISSFPQSSVVSHTFKLHIHSQFDCLGGFISFFHTYLSHFTQYSKRMSVEYMIFICLFCFWLS